MDDQLKRNALDYHEFPRPGKISVTPTKALSNQIDLSLAYSPGVAYACEAIVEDPLNVNRYTSRGNLVGVISNGTAVLGLGNIGPLASKPVMEGKGCLFKAFAGIDVFDIELNETDPDKLVDAIAMLEPTLGGINLEDIKAPECFYIEQKLRERMKIPVFHDDQHGTAIIASAAILNGLRVVNKQMSEIKLVCSGAGAAAIACLNLLVKLGLNKKNVLILDSKGVVTTDRQNLDASKMTYAAETDKHTLAEAIVGADVFLGCSAAGILKADMVKTMADKPLILALANPEPEIRPEIAKQARPDCIVATGRSDYPNQVNNVLCFPFIFRGALDVGATSITEEMKLAAVKAIADLARESSGQSEALSKAYGGQTLAFGPDYIIPKPFDPRLIEWVSPAVAQAAMDSGVATKPIENIEEYRDSLNASVHRSGMIMRPVFALAKQKCARIVFADGEDWRVLNAIEFLVNGKLVKPALIGRPEVIHDRLKKIGSTLINGQDFDIIDPANDPRFDECWQEYYRLCCRLGVTVNMAKIALRKNNTLIGSMLIQLGYIDGMVCGLNDSYQQNLQIIDRIIGKAENTHTYAGMNLLMMGKRNLFICDTYVNEIPTAEQLAEMTLLAAEQISHLGITPKAALLSYSNFGSSNVESNQRMAQARELLSIMKPDLIVDGPMHGDAALSETIRNGACSDSPLSGEANLLIMPNLDAANIVYNLLKITGGEGVTIGPFLLGCKKNVQIVTPAATVRRVINMAAVASADS